MIRISVDFGVGAALSVCTGYGGRFDKVVLFRIDEVRIMFSELIAPCISLGQVGLGHVRLAFVVPTVNPPVHLPTPVERCICICLWVLKFNQSACLFHSC
jgi:hypothetical protein